MNDSAFGQTQREYLPLMERVGRHPEQRKGEPEAGSTDSYGIHYVYNGGLPMKVV